MQYNRFGSRGAALSAPVQLAHRVVLQGGARRGRGVGPSRSILQVGTGWRPARLRVVAAAWAVMAERTGLQTAPCPALTCCNAA